MRNIKAILAAAAMALSPAAFAVDGVSLEYGASDSGNSSVKLYRLGVQWDWGKRWMDSGSYSLGGYWELSGGYWDNSSPAKTNGSLMDVGFTPVFRWQENAPSGISPYVEAAVGLHLLSRTSVSTQRNFGSSFQFGDHIGAGVRLGDKGQYDLGYRYQHLSNAGIKAPNQGINYHQLRLQYHF